jgi:RNA polymerase sigma factor (sigma-70 family)
VKRRRASGQKGVMDEDQAAELFAGLWDRYAQAIHAYCFRRTAEHALAEDLTSVVFLEAWRRHDTQLTLDDALPWLYGVATNVVRNQRRSLRRYRAALSRLPPQRPEPDFAEELVGRLDRESRMREILAYVARLPRRDRDVLALAVWQGLSTADVAKALGVPEATARTRLHRARARLRDLTREPPDPDPAAAKGVDLA